MDPLQGKPQIIVGRSDGVHDAQDAEEAVQQPGLPPIMSFNEASLSTFSWASSSLTWVDCSYKEGKKRGGISTSGYLEFGAECLGLCKLPVPAFLEGREAVCHDGERLSGLGFPS